jgi:hypothetical protein
VLDRTGSTGTNESYRASFVSFIATKGHDRLANVGVPDAEKRSIKAQPFLDRVQRPRFALRH